MARSWDVSMISSKSILQRRKGAEEKSAAHINSGLVDGPVPDGFNDVLSEVISDGYGHLKTKKGG